MKPYETLLTFEIPRTSNPTPMTITLSPPENAMPSPSWNPLRWRRRNASPWESRLLRVRTPGAVGGSHKTQMTFSHWQHINNRSSHNTVQLYVCIHKYKNTYIYIAFSTVSVMLSVLLLDHSPPEILPTKSILEIGPTSGNHTQFSRSWRSSFPYRFILGEQKTPANTAHFGKFTDDDIFDFSKNDKDKAKGLKNFTFFLLVESSLS